MNLKIVAPTIDQTQKRRILDKFEISMPCSLNELQERLTDFASISDENSISLDVEIVDEQPQLTAIVSRVETEKEYKQRITKTRSQHRQAIIYQQQLDLLLDAI